MAVNHKVVGSSPAGTVFIVALQRLCMVKLKHTLISRSRIGCEGWVVLRHVFYAVPQCSMSDAHSRGGRARVGVAQGSERRWCNSKALRSDRQTEWQLYRRSIWGGIVRGEVCDCACLRLEVHESVDETHALLVSHVAVWQMTERKGEEAGTVSCLVCSMNEEV